MPPALPPANLLDNDHGLQSLLAEQPPWNGLDAAARAVLVPQWQQSAMAPGEVLVPQGELHSYIPGWAW